MRIGLLGGSFNPAHEGHRYISLEACKRLGLNAVWWLVTPQNPLKEQGRAASLTARLAQARAVALHPRLVVSGLEAQLGTRFTADTLSALKRRFPRVHFVWIMGADNLVQLPHWRRWTDILAQMPVAVVDRPGHGLKAQLGKAAARFRAARWREADARAFALARPPAWIYLHAKLHPQSATGLRRQGAWPGADPSHPKPRSTPP